MAIGKDEYQFKNQTPEHKAKMKKICEEIFDAGLTPDEIIDAGDYLLNEMSLAELKGEKTDEQKPTSKQQGKKGAAKKADKGGKSGKSKDRPSKKEKSGKSGKDKKSKKKK